MAHRRSDLPEIVLPPSLKNRLQQGHPWVYADQLRGGQALSSGEWVRVRCGGWSAVGLWDRQSAIAVRLFAQQRAPDANWVRERVEAAWLLRAPLRRLAAATTAYRWIYGESDGLPGVVVDLYDLYAVVQIYAESVAVLLPWLVDALRSCVPLRGIIERARPEAGRHDQPAERLRCLWGTPPPPDLTVLENGLRFRANLFVGQKTGLFLDQRDNRQTIRTWAEGREVLNCFSYTAAFSVYAAAGGAHHVVSCDSAAGALGDARVNVALNNLDLSAHEFVVEDCFALLGRYVEQGRQFDMLILDPPSFARSRQQLYGALRAYTRLNALGMRCVRSGGLLATASCTSQVAPDAFRALLSEAAQQAGCRLLTLHDAAQPLDHPVPAHFPEGRYLKFLIGAVQPIA